MTVRTPQKVISNERKIIFEGGHGYYGSLGYRSARTATAEGRSYIAYPGSAHNERDRKKLINQSRDLFANNPIYEGMIERMVSFIIGDGYELQLTGTSKSNIAKIEKLWRDWVTDPEIRGVLKGAEVPKMIMRELFVAGDTLALKTDKGLIQLFEAEQIDGDAKFYPNGIKKDKYGRPIMFSLCPWKTYSVDTRNARPVPLKDVLFLTNPKRPSAIRGVPACQSAFPMLHRINDVCDSEAIAWQLLSRIAVSIEREQGTQLGYTESKEDPNKSAESLEGDMATRVSELDYALMFQAQPGEKVSGIERNIPGKDFTASLRMFLRLLGLPLGCPLELVLLDWTQSNYSQSRAVLEQAYENFSALQKKMKECFYQPLFEWKLEGWRRDLSIADGSKLEAGWITPTFPWLDLLKEVQAWAEKVEKGFATHAQVCKSLKTDRAEVVEHREAEVMDAIERVQRIEEKTGEKVPWQIFAGLEPPKSSAKMAEQEPEDKEDKED